MLEGAQDIPLFLYSKSMVFIFYNDSYVKLMCHYGRAEVMRESMFLIQKSK